MLIRLFNSNDPEILELQFKHEVVLYACAAYGQAPACAAKNELREALDDLDEVGPETLRDLADFALAGL